MFIFVVIMDINDLEIVTILFDDFVSGIVDYQTRDQHFSGITPT